MAPSLFTSNPFSVPNIIQTTSANPFVGPSYIQIPNLPPVPGLTSADQMEVVQFGVSKRLTIEDILNFTISNSPILPVPRGGTGVASFPYDGVLYGTSTAPLRATSQGGANTVLVANAGSPFFSDAITVGTSVTTPLLVATTLDVTFFFIATLTVDNLIANVSIDGPIGNVTPNSGTFTTLEASTSIKNLSLTPTRIIYTGLGGIETDSPNLTFDGAIVQSSGFSGPLNGSVGATTPDTGNFTNVTSNTGNFTTSLTAQTISDLSLGTGEVVYVGLGGNLISDSSFTFSTTMSTLTVPNSIIDNIYSSTNILNLGAFNGSIYENALIVDVIGETVQSLLPMIVSDRVTIHGLNSPIQPQVPTLVLDYVGSGGAITINVPGGVFSSYNFNLPTTSGLFGKPLLSGGGGNTSMFYGSTSGNTSSFATTSGPFTSGNIIISDTFGNLIDGGSPTPGSVNPGLINELGYYAATGSIMSGLPTANNGILVTSPSGIPSISSTLPSLVQTNIISLGTISSGVWQATILDTLYGGTGISFGSSGGILYFSSTITLASSGTLSISDPVVGGGLGLAPTSGTRSGTTTKFATVFGSLVTGNLVVVDALGNLTDAGSPPSFGNVNAGLIDQLGYYATSGSTISGLPTANNGVLITSAGGVPSISSILPFAVQTNITELGIISVGTWNGSIIPVLFGGTGGSSFTTNGVLFGNGTSALQVTAQGGANSVLVANAGPPSFSSSPTIVSLTTTTSITNSSLTSGRVIFSSVGGLETDSSNLTFSGTILTSTGFSGPLNGTVGVITPNTGSFTTLLASTSITNSSLTSGRVIFSTAGGLETDSSNLTFSGTILTSTGFSGPLNGTVGVITPNTGSFTTLLASTSITNSALTSGRVIFSGAAGIETDSANLTFSGTILTSTGFSGPLNGTVGAVTPASGAFSSLKDTSAAINRIPYTTTGGSYIYSSNLTFDGTIFQTSTAKASALGLIGSISGTVTIQTQAVAGTYTVTLPNTAGSSGQPILSGGGASPLSYGTLSGNTSTFATVSGALISTHGVVVDVNGNLVDTGAPPSSGSVNAGTINQMAWYASTGSVVSGLSTLASGLLNTNGSGIPSISASPTISGTFTAGGFNLSGVAGTRVVFLDGAGNLLTNSNFTYNGTTLTLPSVHVGSAQFQNGGNGQVTIAPSATVFTNFTMTLPTTAGSAGQVLASQGGGGTPMTWVTPGSGTVNSGLINQLAYYATSGTAVSGLATANNSVLITSSSGAPSFPANVANAILNTNGVGGAPQLTTNPFISGTLTVPFLYGGQAANSSLMITSTSGVGTTDFIQFFTGNSLPRLIINTSGEIVVGNGDTAPAPIGGTIRAASAASVVNIAGANLTIAGGNGTGTGGSGQILFNAAAPGASGTTPDTYSTVMNISSSLGVRIGSGSNATSQLHLGVGTTTAGTSPLKFISGTSMTTPETGAIEYDGSNLYVTNHSIRRSIFDGAFSSLPTATITTSNANFAAISIVSAESYMFEINVKLTLSASVIVVGFNGGSVAADTLSVEQVTAANVVTNSVVANSGTTVTCPGNMIMLRVTGFISATASGSFSMTLRTVAGTITLNAGSYFKYIQF